MKKRLLVLSFDALGAADFEYLQTHEIMREFFNTGAICKNVASVYPSVTYACHTSIVTGLWPKNHGIVANTLVQKNRVNNPDWYWQRKYIKSETIYDIAIKSGYTTASFLWPVTAKSKIKYHLPEIFPNRKWDTQIFSVLRNGNPYFLIEIFKRYRHMLNGIKQPNLDDFVTESVVFTIKEKKPDFMLVHFTDLDTARHDYGVNSQNAYDAIDRLVSRFKKIVDVLKEVHLFEETNIVILGDHYQIDFHTKVALNELFEKSNWLTVKNEQIIKYRALVKSNAGSAYIYVNDNETNLDELRIFLEKLQQNPKNGIEKILTKAEAASLGADSECAFILEAKEGFVFTDSFGGGEKGKVAEHGYNPTDKGNYKTFYAMSGPDVASSVEVSGMRLIDIAPTWAKMLNLDIGVVDGLVVEDMIK